MHTSKNISRMLLSTLTGLLTLWSCNNTLSENTEHDRVITFDLKTADCGVKSSIDLAEDKIVDINIFAFIDGIACGHLFTEESSRAKIILPSGEFTVYIAANLGKMKKTSPRKKSFPNGVTESTHHRHWQERPCPIRPF